MKRLIALVLALALVGGAAFAQLQPASKAKLAVQTKEPKTVAAFLVADKNPTRGGTLTLRIPGSPQSWNFYGVIDNNAYEVIMRFLDPLVEANPVTQEIEPCLAKSWTVKGNEVTFNLRDMKWSDGVPLSADDVVFTFNNFIMNKNANGNNLMEYTSGGQPFVFSKVDAKTVKVTMAAPSGTLFRSLTNARIYPKHALEKFVDPADAGSVNKIWTTDTDPARIPGTGAFILDKYIVDQKVVLKRNPYSFRVDTAGNLLPYADALEYLVVKDNEAAMLKFMAGEIDYIDVSAAQFPTLKEKELAGGPFSIYRTEPTRNVPSLLHISFNQDAKNPELKTLFRNVEFRRAMELSLDRAKVIDQVYQGLAVLGGSPVLPSNKAFYNPKIEKIRRSYKPEEARKAFDKLGLKDTNGDGWRELPSGKPLEFVVSVSTEKEHQETAMLYTEALKKLGVKAEPQVLDPNLLGQKLNAGDFEVGMRAFGNQVDPHLRKGIWQPGNHLYYWKLSTMGADKKIDLTTLEPWEKELYDIFEKGATELDQAKRKALYDRHQEIYADYVPVIFVCKGMNLYGSSKKIGNYYQDKAGLINYAP
ncbi:MAG: ABC transporter substrate-binding protein, partial [Spirochaetaceae bacterium]|nr:ABC transporter substrate-binding protein [Spirochaetaceae bacterium]